MGEAGLADGRRDTVCAPAGNANVQRAIEGLSDADLKTPVKLFGRDMTKEDAVRFLFGDQHEHLGQSIAYARSNGVTPPWSEGAEQPAPAKK